MDNYRFLSTGLTRHPRPCNVVPMNTLEDWFWDNSEHTEARSCDGRWLVRLGYRRNGVESYSSLVHSDTGLVLVAEPATQDIKTIYITSTTRAKAIWAGFLDWKERNH